MWTLYNLQFSNYHHNIAVNVTLHLSLREKKYTVNLRRFYSTATREKVPENPKRPQPFIHSFTLRLSCTMIYTASTHSKVSHTRTYTNQTTSTHFWPEWSKSEITWTEMECAVRRTPTGYLFLHEGWKPYRLMEPTVREPDRWGDPPQRSHARSKAYRVLLYCSVRRPQSSKQIHLSNISTSIGTACSWGAHPTTL